MTRTQDILINDECPVGLIEFEIKKAFESFRAYFNFCACSWVVFSDRVTVKYVWHA